MQKFSTCLQAEAAECGLACLQMILSAHGRHEPLSALRRQFPVGIKGATLKRLVQVAKELDLETRAVTLRLEELSQLRLPCILHWNFNHFVVLSRVGVRTVEIHDPAVGRRTLTMEGVSGQFTGVALELSPTQEFVPAPTARKKIHLSAVAGRISGLRSLLIQIFCLALVLECLGVVGPLIQQVVVDDVLSSSDRELLTVLVVGFALLLVIQTLLHLARTWISIHLTQTFSLQWKGGVFRHMLHLPSRYFEARGLGDLASRFQSISALQAWMTGAAVEAVLDSIMAVVALVMMLLYSPMMSAVTLGALFLFGLVRWVSYTSLREASAERITLAAKENSFFLESIRAYLPIKLFGIEADRYSGWQNSFIAVQNRDLKTARLGMLFSTANKAIFGAENLAVLYLGAALIMGTGSIEPHAEAFTVGMMFAYFSYKSQFIGRASALIGFYVDYKMLSLHIERVADIVHEKAESDNHSALPVLSGAPATLELRDVGFKFEGSDAWLFRGINLRVSENERLAIIGPSGVGKTTLLKIILGLERPTEGSVLYGGVKIPFEHSRALRKVCGAVMQEDQLLTGSIADNISMFEAEADQGAIEECARRASIHEDILKMPMGYSTLVGELGAGLSGGQKQRVLLARALYRRPRLLVLDEATSSLDTTSERAVIASLRELAMTQIVVAHRPDTIASADKIFNLGRTAQAVVMK